MAVREALVESANKLNKARTMCVLPFLCVWVIGYSLMGHSLVAKDAEKDDNLLPPVINVYDFLLAVASFISNKTL